MSEKSRNSLRKAVDIKLSYGLTFQLLVQLHLDQLHPDNIFLDCPRESKEQNVFDGMADFFGSQAETKS